MSKSLRTFIRFSGMLSVLLSATTYSPAKASAQSLLPDIDILEGGQICLALCTSPRTTTPSPTLSTPNSVLGGLASQVLQIPGQVLQTPQQILPSLGAQVIRPVSPAPISSPVVQSNTPPVVTQAIPPVSPQSTTGSQSSRPTFLQRIAPVLPQVIQQLSR